jgi:Spy/CpxP family protein refolding chaperone
MTIKTLSLGAALVALLGTTGVALLAQRQASGPQNSQQAANPTGSGGQRSGGPQRPYPKPWWQDEASKKELGLTVDQAKQLEVIYASAKEEGAGYLDAFKREEKELDRLIADPKAEQWMVLRQIDRVETQRSNYNKLRTMTLYRMNRQLTPDQRVKLQQIKDRDHRDPRKRP